MSGAPIVVRDINSIESVLQQAREELQRNEKSYWRNTERECAQLVNDCVSELELYLKERGVRLPHMNANATESYLRGRYRQASLLTPHPMSANEATRHTNNSNNNNTSIGRNSTTPLQRNEEQQQQQQQLSGSNETSNTYDLPRRAGPQPGHTQYTSTHNTTTLMGSTDTINTTTITTPTGLMPPALHVVRAASPIDSDSTPMLSPSKGIAALSSTTSPPPQWVNRAIPAASQDAVVAVATSSSAVVTAPSQVRVGGGEVHLAASVPSVGSHEAVSEQTGQSRGKADDEAVHREGRGRIERVRLMATGLRPFAHHRTLPPATHMAANGAAAVAQRPPVGISAAIEGPADRLGGHVGEAYASQPHLSTLPPPPLLPATTPMSDRSVYQSVAPSVPLRPQASFSSPGQSTSAMNSPARSPQAPVPLTVLHPVSRPVMQRSPYAAHTTCATVLPVHDTRRVQDSHAKATAHADAHVPLSNTPHAGFMMGATSNIASERIRMSARHNVPATHHASPALRMSWLIEKHYGRPAMSTPVNASQQREGAAEEKARQAIEHHEDAASNAQPQDERAGIAEAPPTQGSNFHTAFRAQPRLQCFTRPHYTPSLADLLDATPHKLNIHDAIREKEGCTCDVVSGPANTAAAAVVCPEHTVAQVTSDTMQRSKAALAARVRMLLSRSRSTPKEEEDATTKEAVHKAAYSPAPREEVCEGEAKEEAKPVSMAAPCAHQDMSHDAPLRRATASLTSLLAHTAAKRSEASQPPSASQVAVQPQPPAAAVQAPNELAEEDKSKTASSGTQVTDECEQKQRTAIYTDAEGKV